MENEIVIIEDVKKDAQELIEEIGLDMYTKFLTTLEEASEYFQLDKGNKKLCYIVDLNLGKKEPKGGLELIKTIRKDHPCSLIIMYTAHLSSEEECKKAGADIFILKDPARFDKDCILIRDLIIREKKRFEENEKKDNIITNRQITTTMKEKIGSSIDNHDIEKSTEIPAQILKSNKDHVYLNCMIDIEKQKIVEKKFPIIPFKGLGKLSIGKSLMITIKEKINQVYWNIDDSNSNEIDKLFIEKNEKEFLDGDFSFYED